MSAQTLSRIICGLAAPCVVGACLAAGFMPSVVAQTNDLTFSNPTRFMPRDGEMLYRSSCQACHMAAGEGASGAGAYPALAKNPKLQTARYATSVVVRGSRAMPSFGGQMDDEQVAAVVNYVRTHLGNNYKDPVATADVKIVRQ